MIIKIWMCLSCLNLLYVVAKENVFDPKYGLKVKDFLAILFLVLTPVGSIVFALCLWDDIKNAFPKLMNYYIVKPEIQKKESIPLNKYILINDAVSGRNKTRML